VRTNWIDYCKALGILLVVFGHVHRGLEKSGLVTNDLFFLFSDSVIYTFHMPLFFFLSGLLFFKSRKSDKELIASKIDTIVYPYFLWSILQGMVEFFLREHTNQHSASNDFLFKLFIAPENQFWFLYALFFCFLTAILIFKIIGKKYLLGILFISILAYLASQFLPKIFIVGIVSRYFVFFFLGFVLSPYILDKKEFSVFISKTRALATLVCAATLFQYYYHSILGYTFINNNIPSILLSSLMILTTISFCMWLSIRINSNVLTNLGTSSMVIFLMHVFATSGIRIVLKDVLNIHSYSLHLILGTFVGVVFPLVMMTILDKINIKYYVQAPLSKWLAKVS
jgi:fucose 4-O-acetylase-like acetyltransferase